MSNFLVSSLMSASPRQANPPCAARSAPRGSRMLTALTTGWWLIALVGQAIFTAYLGALYGVASLHGDFQRWNDVMPRGWVRGEVTGNLVVAGHLAFAALVFASGALQLSGRVRQIVPRVHRWNGRFYLAASATLAATGIVLVFSGRAPGDAFQHAGTALNALLILAFGAMTLRQALLCRFASHARWAMRLLLAVAGVWFFRIGLMAWIVLNRGPVGFDPDTFRGPTLTGLAFAQTLLPLAILEGTLRAKRGTSTMSHWAMTAVLAMSCLLTLVGTAAATLLMWWPHIRH
jgi:hypothetical protein